MSKKTQTECTYLNVKILYWRRVYNCGVGGSWTCSFSEQIECTPVFRASPLERQLRVNWTAPARQAGERDCVEKVREPKNCWPSPEPSASHNHVAGGGSHLDVDDRWLIRGGCWRLGWLRQFLKIRHCHLLQWRTLLFIISL